ncbi:MAG: MliC family protein [Candidatus Paceibacterota bacterium]
MHDIAHTKYRAIIVAFIVLFVAILILAVWPDVRRTESETEKEKATILAKAMYQCRDGKSVYAVYVEGAVKLELSDLRARTLPQTVAGSGARYATLNGGFVFWSKGDTAFIQENNILTFTDCIRS